MALCRFCKKVNDRKNKRYCKNCNQMYLRQQQFIHESLRVLDSDLVHRRKFKLCKCQNEIVLPKKKYCEKCYVINTRNLRFKKKIRELTQFCLRNNIILKPKACEFCSSSDIEAHHENYFEPFKIKWLCKKHHYKAHVILKKDE